MRDLNVCFMSTWNYVQLELLLTWQLCMIFLNVLLCLREVTQFSASESLLLPFSTCCIWQWYEQGLNPTKQKRVNHFLSPLCWSKKMQKNQKSTLSYLSFSHSSGHFLWEHITGTPQISTLIIKSYYSL